MSAVLLVSSGSVLARTKGNWSGGGKHRRSKSYSKNQKWNEIRSYKINLCGYCVKKTLMKIGANFFYYYI